ncbi:MAG TPA: hypothetical protein VMX54_06610 [Vicinamibacteria bacterium]|nr:hypothetical protein [Vicinamibacteria bacterium]
MPNRRAFLQSTGIAAGLALRSATASAAQNTTPQRTGNQVQVPRMRFAGAEISRLVVGCNPFYGFSHFNRILGTVMREYYTPERVCEVLHRCSRFGINAYNYVGLGRAPQDLQRFQAEGGRMHLIVQGMGGPETILPLKPLAVYHHGEMTDRAYDEGKMETVREWCKRCRDAGLFVGVGSHRPDILAFVEEKGWDVDFYAGCVYNRTRPAAEWKRLLNGEALEMPQEVYLRSDPPRMYDFMRRTRKPCFAFKIMAAGRIEADGADQAFRQAFASIKPTDGVFIGIFPRAGDEVRENAERVQRILTGA